MRGAAMRARKSRACSNCFLRARCVRSPETATTSASAVATAASSGSRTVSSTLPKWRSERWTSVRMKGSGRCGRFAGDDEQARRPGTVAQRRSHHRDLAVGGDAQTASPALDVDADRAHRVEVARLLEPAENRVQSEHQKLQPAGALRDVEAEAAGVESLALADREALHRVDVVADEDERRSPQRGAAVDRQAHTQERESPDRADRRPDERCPLAAAEA